MHAIQAFLMAVLSSFVSLTILIFLGQALAEEVTIYDKDWRIKGHIEDGRVYDRDWRLQNRIEGGKIYDRNWTS